MPERPNILFITADQFRWDCLGCGGNEVIQTPHLDALAARGMIARNAFSPNPICVPARASIMTGNYPQTCTGVKNNGGQIRANQPLLTEILRGVGYRTYALGKLHFVPYSPPSAPRLVHGFEHVDLHESGRLIGQFDPAGKLSGLEDYFDYLKTVGWSGYTRAHGIGNNDVRSAASPLPSEHHVDHWIADCTISAIDRHLNDAPENPFLMWMSSPRPHAPYAPPRPYDAMYDPREVPAPVGSAADIASRNPSIAKMRHTHALDSLSPESLRVIRAYYYGCISFLDAMIGRVIAHLTAKDLIDKTLIVFTSDHGDLLGDFGGFFKGNHLNASVRLPFIAAGPGVKPGSSSDALIGLQDIVPTFAAAARTTPGQPVQGEDLSKIFAGKSKRVREWYYATSGDTPAQTAMITDGIWKYIYTEANATEELYDQVNDPWETKNLAAEAAQAERLKRLREKLREHAIKFDDENILDGEGFAQVEVDVAAFADLPVRGMGWRWY